MNVPNGHAKMLPHFGKVEGHRMSTVYRQESSHVKVWWEEVPMSMQLSSNPEGVAGYTSKKVLILPLGHIRVSWWTGAPISPSSSGPGPGQSTYILKCHTESDASAGWRSTCLVEQVAPRCLCTGRLCLPQGPTPSSSSRGQLLHFFPSWFL